MEKFKAPLSFRIIHIVNEIIFWLFSALSVVAVIFAILVLTGVISDDLQLRVGLPVSFTPKEIGYLTVNSTPVSVQLVEAHGSIHLIDTPGYLAKPFMAPLLFVVAALFFMLYTFRRFIRNMKNGLIFETGNIKLLRLLSFSVIGFWFFWNLYEWLVGLWFSNRLEFGTVELVGEMPDHGILLLGALVLWVLSHIFMKGMELQEEQKLTI